MVDFLHEGREELYDLSADPEERINLADSDAPGHASAREALRAKILRRMRELGDPVLPAR